MVDLVEAGGMTGTPEAIREFYELINCDPGEALYDDLDDDDFESS